MAVDLLERPLYSIGEAAALLRLPSSTLRRWLEGAEIAGKRYPPVVRPVATGSEAVTWGEFVEAGLLRGYRQKRVSMQWMRPFIDRMRQEFGVPYPLAHFRPLVDNKKLVYELQIEVDLPPALFLVQATADQMVWAEPVRDFLEKVEFAPEVDVPIRLFPLGKEQPVVIDPDISFGVPQIRGIRTELIAESVKAGGLEEAVASWGIGPADVDAAVSWESSLAKAA